MSFIEIRGDEDILVILDDVEWAAGQGELGRVYSAGAIGPYGQRYERYVQKEGEQASIHAGRWQTEEDAARDTEQDAQAVMDGVFADVIRGGGASAMREGVDEVLRLVKEYMQDYPPPPPGSTYARTNTLHDSWEEDPWV